MSLQAVPAGYRYCPLCDNPMVDPVCPVHCVPTLDPSVLTESDAHVQPGDTVDGRYRLDRGLGRGGTATVFEAFDSRHSRAVAVKVLRRSLAGDPTHVKRFYREALAVSRLDHQNIVKTVDFGVDARTHAPYLAMEILRGLRLDKVVKKEGPLPERRAARLLSQIALGLGHAHEKALVHRDLKPANIFVVRAENGAETVKVLDFGIAKLFGGDTDEQEELTQVGTRVGTPAYMSPEQIRGRELDGRSDLYSLGCILTLLLTGRPPFQIDDGLGLFMAHLNQKPASLPKPLPTGLDGAGEEASRGMVALHRALLSKSPSIRPPTAGYVFNVLCDLAEGREPKAFLSEYPKVEPRGTNPLQIAVTGDPLAASEEHTVTVSVTEAQAASKAAAAAVGANEPEDERGAGWMWLAAAAVLLLVGGGLWFGGVFDGTTKNTGPSGTQAVASSAGTASASPVAAGQGASAPGAPGTQQVPNAVPAEPAPAPLTAARAPVAADASRVTRRGPMPTESVLPSLVRLVSTPAGASVHYAGKVVGTTPFEWRPPTGDREARLTIKHRGYRSKTVSIAEASNDSLRVVLGKTGRSVGKKTGGAKSTTGPKAGSSVKKPAVPVW